MRSRRRYAPDAERLPENRHLVAICAAARHAGDHRRIRQQSRGGPWQGIGLAVDCRRIRP